MSPLDETDRTSAKGGAFLGTSREGSTTAPVALSLAPSSGEEGPAVAPAAGASGDLGRGAPLGRYLILSRLGRGGMGEVLTAYDPELDRRVALKLLHTAGGSERARKRLLSEARALAKLSHPNVV